MMKQDRKICVGMIAGPHGVRGLIRLRSFTEDPVSLLTYDPLTDETGETCFSVTVKSAAKDFFIASLDGVDNREAAEALRGTKLYVDRSVLPPPDEAEYYETDLIGLVAKDKAGVLCGTVRGVHDYGAGSFLEIKPSEGDSYMLPFNDDCVPAVDVEGGFITVEVPAGWLEEAKATAEAKLAKKAAKKVKE